MPRKKASAGWDCRLSTPIMLRDKTVLKTMGEAAKLITARLPAGRQLKPLWQKTAQDLMAACESGDKVDIAHATAQLRRALEAEGWL